MPLRRTTITWAIYCAGASWAAVLYLAGPVAPVLAEALGVPISWSGLLGTAMALGAITAAWLTPNLVGRVGRDRAMRLGLALLAASLLLLAAAPTVLGGTAGFIAALVLMWVVATGGNTQLNASTARLADTHPEHSATVITEMNAVAAWAGLASPLLLGLALGAGLEWWVGVLICLAGVLAALAYLVLAGRRMTPTAADVRGDADRELVMVVGDEAYLTADSDQAPHHPLPRVFRVCLLALFAAVATEFAINFWGSPLIQEQTGAAASTATTAMSGSVFGVALGRTIGPRLISRFGPHTMLLGGFALTLVGFFVLWSAGTVALSVVGLVLAGLGLSTLFPLIIDRAILLSDGEPDLAMSRAAYVVGLAIGLSPFLLGALGTVMSVQSAMLLVPAIVALGVVGVVGSKPRAVAASTP